LNADASFVALIVNVCSE
jgi:hypothetical protein